MDALSRMTVGSVPTAWFETVNVLGPQTGGHAHRACFLIIHDESGTCYGLCEASALDLAPHEREVCKVLCRVKGIFCEIAGRVPEKPTAAVKLLRRVDLGAHFLRTILGLAEREILEPRPQLEVHVRHFVERELNAERNRLVRQGIRFTADV